MPWRQSFADSWRHFRFCGKLIDQFARRGDKRLGKWQLNSKYLYRPASLLRQPNQWTFISRDGASVDFSISFVSKAHFICLTLFASRVPLEAWSDGKSWAVMWTNSSTGIISGFHDGWSVEKVDWEWRYWSPCVQISVSEIYSIETKNKHLNTDIVFHFN